MIIFSLKYYWHKFQFSWKPYDFDNQISILFISPLRMLGLKQGLQKI